MPPNSAPNSRAASPNSTSGSFAFQRAHPRLTTCLITSARLTQPLLVVSLLFNSNVLKRPLKQRVFIWYLAYLSFYSRHILALLSLGWLLTGGERRAARAERDGNREEA